MTVCFEKHANIEAFDVEAGVLSIDGRPVPEIVEGVGETPLYIYSASAIKKRVKALRHAMPKGLHLHYAIKANPMPDVVALLNGLVDGLDVASAGEIDIAVAAGADPDSVSFAGPGKSDQELRHAISSGVTVNLESPGEMRRLAALADEMGKCPCVAVRVNPAFEVRQSGMKMGGGPKPFGIDEEQVPGLLREMASLPLEFVGFHIFGGSQNLDEDVLVDCHEKTVDLAIRLSKDAPGEVRDVNIGGGYGIPYFPGEEPLRLQKLGDALAPLQQKLQRALPGVTMVMELGRYLVGEAGLYVSRILDVKESRGEQFAVTDGGMHHHLALSGNFGQVIRKNYPLVLATKADTTPMQITTIVGRLCTPLDRMGDKVLLPQVEVGDLVVVFQSGAYGPSASPGHFLGHPAPMEVLI
jgi:diaminopimelate decarboxylase